MAIPMSIVIRGFAKQIPEKQRSCFWISYIIGSMLSAG